MCVTFDAEYVKDHVESCWQVRIKAYVVVLFLIWFENFKPV